MAAAAVTAPPLHALSLLLPGASFRSHLGTNLSPDATQMSALHWEAIGLLMVLSPTSTAPAHLPEPPTHSPASKPTAGLQQKDEHEPGHLCTGKRALCWRTAWFQALRWRTVWFRPHGGAAGTGAGSQADTSPLWRPQFPFTEMGGLDSHVIAQWNEITSVKVLSRQALTSTVPHTSSRGDVPLGGRERQVGGGWTVDPGSSPGAWSRASAWAAGVCQAAKKEGLRPSW